MRKKLLCLLGLVLLCSSCAAKTSQTSNTPIPSVTLLGSGGEVCTLTLKTPADKVVEQLKAVNFPLKGDYKYQLYGDSYNLFFAPRYIDSDKKEWVLTEISVETDKVPTAEGLKQGDSVAQMENLYGKSKDITKNTEGAYSYVYDKGAYSLQFSSGDNKNIGEWNLILNRSDHIVLTKVVQNEETEPGEFIMKPKGKESLRFYLGMKESEAVSLFEKGKIEFDESEYDYDFDKCTTISYEGINLGFRTAGNAGDKILKTINVFTKLYPTAKGLRVGDSSKKLLSLYPDGNMFDYDTEEQYEYKMGNHYFYIATAHDEIYAWRLYADKFDQ